MPRGDDLMMRDQHEPCDFTIKLVIINQKKAEGVARLLPGSRHGPGEPRCFVRFIKALQRDRHMKTTALADCALHPNAATHQPGQLLADGQPKAGTAILPGMRIVGLFKAFENALNFFRSNAHAGIRHRTMQFNH